MSKSEAYRELAGQVAALLRHETDPVSNMANAAALIHEALQPHWTGFYVLAADGTLHLGPFQGPVACTRIPAGRGVCGTALQERRTLVVPDVDAFPGHIACSSLSRSEIVVPLFAPDGRVLAVLDIDSRHLSAYDDEDARHLEEIAGIVAAALTRATP
ncbi:MAG: GAF domain-containing protein [Alloprevotella sp.]|nr:GAF domain-containing protein [Alloprevotella sp.]